MAPRPSLLSAAWRIARGTAAYRIQKREAGNLVTSGALALALGLAPGDVAYRLGFGAVLNLFVYLVNDCADVAIDLRAPGRDRGRTEFLAANLTAGWWLVGLLGAALLALGLAHGPGLAITFTVNAVVIFAYSMWLKHRPLLDLVAMAAWGLSMAMVGFPLTSADGWKLAGLLSLLCVVTEGVQVIRDEASDRASGVRTTAVALGPHATAWLTRVVIVASAAYTTLLLHRFVGPLLLVTLLVPLAPARIERAWDALRAGFGLGWLAVLIAFARSGRLAGLL